MLEFLFDINRQRATPRYRSYTEFRYLRWRFRNIDFRKIVSECIINRYESDEEDDEKNIEEKIYGGFYSNEDKAILENFQLGTWEERLNLLSRFSDERLIQLGRRLIAFNAPELLTTKEKNAFDEYLKNKWESEDTKSN